MTPDELTPLGEGYPVVARWDDSLDYLYPNTLERLLEQFRAAHPEHSYLGIGYPYRGCTVIVRMPKSDDEPWRRLMDR